MKIDTNKTEMVEGHAVHIRIWTSEIGGHNWRTLYDSNLPLGHGWSLGDEVAALKHAITHAEFRLRQIDARSL